MMICGRDSNTSSALATRLLPMPMLVSLFLARQMGGRLRYLDLGWNGLCGYSSVLILNGRDVACPVRCTAALLGSTL
jgi:hypothetical protein